MKKLSLLFGLAIISITSWTFMSFNTDDDKVDVTISSPKPLKFDLYMYQEGKVLKGLTTPYAFTVENNVAHYIIKSSKPKSEVQMEAKRNGKTSLKASW